MIHFQDRFCVLQIILDRIQLANEGHLQSFTSTAESPAGDQEAAVSAAAEGHKSAFDHLRHSLPSQKEKKRRKKTFFDSRCPGEPQCV